MNSNSITKKFYYLVSYRYFNDNDNDNGWGRCEIVRDKKILTMENIENIEKSIASTKPNTNTKILIMNLIFLREEREQR
jgi:hypothetical protein